MASKKDAKDSQLAVQPEDEHTAQGIAHESRGEFAAAVTCYERAVAGSHAVGIIRLGMLLEDGKAGVPADVSRAVALYDQAAELGHPYALALVGLTHQYGIGRDAPDLPRAAGYYRLGLDVVPHHEGCAALLQQCQAQTNKRPSEADDRPAKRPKTTGTPRAKAGKKSRDEDQIQGAPQSAPLEAEPALAEAIVPTTIVLGLAPAFLLAKLVNPSFCAQVLASVRRCRFSWSGSGRTIDEYDIARELAGLDDSAIGLERRLLNYNLGRFFSAKNRTFTMRDVRRSLVELAGHLFEADALQPGDFFTADDRVETWPAYQHASPVGRTLIEKAAREVLDNPAPPFKTCMQLYQMALWVARPPNEPSPEPPVLIQKQSSLSKKAGKLAWYCSTYFQLVERAPALLHWHPTEVFDANALKHAPFRLIDEQLLGSSDFAALAAQHLPALQKLRQAISFGGGEASKA